MWGDVSCPTEMGWRGPVGGIAWTCDTKLQRLSPSPTPLIMAPGTLVNYSHRNGHRDSAEHYYVLAQSQVCGHSVL